MSARAQSTIGRYAIIAAALSLLATRITRADDAVGFARVAAVQATHQSLGGALAALPRALPRTLGHASSRRPLSLDVPNHVMFGAREPLPSTDDGDVARFRAAFAIRWQKEEPQIFRTARAFRHQGLPLVHLWQSDSGEHMLSIGLNQHGVPGIWLTQKVPD